MITTTPSITTEVARKHDTFTVRTTDLRGRTFSADASEFSDHGEPVERIMLSVHHEGYYPDDTRPPHANVVSGLVSIDIGDLTVWLPKGCELAVAGALDAAIREQARQNDAGTEETVVFLTGNAKAEVAA